MRELMNTGFTAPDSSFGARLALALELSDVENKIDSFSPFHQGIMMSIDCRMFSQAIRIACTANSHSENHILATILRYRDQFLMNLNEQTVDQKRSALHLAAISGNEWAYKKLLQCGAADNLQDSQGNTPAHYAKISGIRLVSQQSTDEHKANHSSDNEPKRNASTAVDSSHSHGLFNQTEGSRLTGDIKPAEATTTDHFRAATRDEKESYENSFVRSSGPSAPATPTGSSRALTQAQMEANVQVYRTRSGVFRPLPGHTNNDNTSSWEPVPLSTYQQS